MHGFLLTFSCMGVEILVTTLVGRNLNMRALSNGKPHCGADLEVEELLVNTSQYFPLSYSQALTELCGSSEAVSTPMDCRQGASLEYLQD